MELPKTDRRIQRTRQLLQNALIELILEQGYESLTVQEIIDRANIGRSTFYAHFQDLESLFLSGFETMWAPFADHLLNQSPGEGSPWNVSLLMFQHAENHRRLYKALAGKQGGNLALSHIHKRLTEIVAMHLRKQISTRKPQELSPEMLAHYLVSAFMALLTWWLDHELPIRPERMNEIYRQLTESGFQTLLKS